MKDINDGDISAILKELAPLQDKQDIFKILEQYSSKSIKAILSCGLSSLENNRKSS